MIHKLTSFGEAHNSSLFIFFLKQTLAVQDALNSTVCNVSMKYAE